MEPLRTILGAQFASFPLNTRFRPLGSAHIIARPPLWRRSRAPAPDPTALATYNATAMEDVLVMVPQFSSCMCVAQFTDDNADGYDMCRADATGEWRSGAHEF